MIVNLNPSNDDSTEVDLIANSIYSYEWSGAQPELYLTEMALGS
jgi:hypothetical protein